MHFIIVHGNGCDQEAVEVIYQRLSQKGISSEILTDEEFLRNGRWPEGYFVISVGGKAVNSVSGRIQEIYSRALDVSKFDVMKSFCYCWGSKDGVKTNAYLNCGCLALWGPRMEDTLKTSEDFILEGALLDSIVPNYTSWTKKAKLIPI